ncbi:MAG: transporter permease [Thermoleophilia bacterium]|nr:transporter permease [Thermoleophilia bacterium]
MSLFTFPNPVNDKAARTVAAGVFVLGAVTLVTGWAWLAAVLAFGFLLRVLSGPRFSPLGRIATRFVAPRLGPAQLVPGPPKRFAQAVGLAFTTAVTILLATGHDLAGGVVLGVLLVFAFAESALGFCAGCWVFAHLMRWGVIPRSVCLACANTAYEV